MESWRDTYSAFVYIYHDCGCMDKVTEYTIVASCEYKSEINRAKQKIYNTHTAHIHTNGEIRDTFLNAAKKEKGKGEPTVHCKVCSKFTSSVELRNWIQKCLTCVKQLCMYVWTGETRQNNNSLWRKTTITLCFL